MTKPPEGLSYVRIPTFQKVLWDTVLSRWVQWEKSISAVDRQMWAPGPSWTDSLLAWAHAGQVTNPNAHGDYQEAEYIYLYS